MILLKNASLNNKVCDILIDKNKIAKITDKLDTSADEIVDCTDKAILPSFCILFSTASIVVTDTSGNILDISFLVIGKTLFRIVASILVVLFILLLLTVANLLSNSL